MANDKQKLTVVLEGDSKRLEKALKAADRALKNTDTQAKKTSSKSGGVGMLNTAFRRLAAYGAAGIVISGVKRFVSDSVRMAASLEGVERQFKEVITSGETSLGELREATRGAVSDFKLMQSTVRASNFDIPLNKLAGLLEFARIRAQQTGESVEYLSDSIILGLGRKSPLILDNLGITMIRLKEAMGGSVKSTVTVRDLVEAVGVVAEESTARIKELGLTTDTTATKMGSFDASIRNLKEEFGKSIIETNLFKGTLDALLGTIQSIGAKAKAKSLAVTMGIDSEDFESIVDENTFKQSGLLKGITNWEAVLSSLEKKQSDIISKVKQNLEFLYPETQALKAASSVTELEESYSILVKKIQDLAGGQMNESRQLTALSALREERLKELNSEAESTSKLIETTLGYNESLKELKDRLFVTGNYTDFVSSKTKLLEDVLTTMKSEGLEASDAFKELNTEYLNFIKNTKSNELAEFKLKNFIDNMKDVKIDGIKLDLSDNKVYKDMEQQILNELSNEDFGAVLREYDKSNMPITDEANEKIQKASNLMQGLSQAFNTAITSGQSFGDVMVDVFKRILAQITATLAAAVVLSIITGGATSVKGILTSFGAGGGGGFAGAFFDGLFGGEASTSNPITSSGNIAASSAGRSAINVQVQGVMRGSDIYFSGQRGNNFVSKRLG